MVLIELLSSMCDSVIGFFQSHLVFSSVLIFILFCIIVKLFSLSDGFSDVEDDCFNAVLAFCVMLVMVIIIGITFFAEKTDSCEPDSLDYQNVTESVLK